MCRAGWETGSISTSANQKLGWISVTRCVGSSAEIPPWINVRLRYAIGAVVELSG